ncbi:MAG: (Fe-S)-binding protein [Bradymonadaceae bacterium]
MARKVFGDPVDKMTAYCTYCPKMCRFSCPAAQAEDRETVTPWGMMRLFELVKDDAVEPSQEVAEIFYHCMGCRRCQTWCRHENDVPHAMWEARAWMAEQGFVPPVLEGFAESFLKESFPHKEPAAPGETPGESTTVDEIFDSSSDYFFFPDCETRQHSPDLVLRAGKLLEMVCGKKVRLVTTLDGAGKGCCGFPLLSAGRKEEYLRYRAELEDELSGAKVLITDCAAMASLHRKDTSWGFESALEVTHLVELLSSTLGRLEVPHRIDLSDLIFHDSCFTGRQLDLFDATRDVVRALGTGDFEEFPFTREEASCCGGPGHYHLVEPEASERCAETLMDEMDQKGAKGVICGSATCKKAFGRVRKADVAQDILEIACRAFGV